ncbi:alpha/beta-hydrolase, partial [Wilcoxina mikolae CBS 423.85]
MDELQCANLVITTPTGEGKWPVIVWMHGGAYKVSSANFAAYDTKNIVRHSVEIGMPVVVVSVNHRLNSLGSTATKELGAGVESGNWLLKDERCALEWVQRQIAGFGGDPENITYFGESAGSCSGSIHLYSPARLFDRAILLSGLAGLLPPRPVEAQHEHYLELCKKLNITTSNPQQRAAAFLGTPAIDIAKLAFDVQTVPTSDGTLIPSRSWIRHENFTPNPQWCKSVLIGSCRDEWAIMALGGGIEKYAHPAAVFRQRLIKEAGVSAEDVELLFRLFKVGEDMEWEEQVRQLYVMISDYGFRRPAWAFADYNAQLGRKTYLAGMYMGSPFDGVNKGRAHHAIDIMFSFQNFLEHFPKDGGYIELARRITTAWIKYAYG